MSGRRDGKELAQVRVELAAALLTTEGHLRGLGLWEAMPPTPDRLASEIPFCHDTLEFTQWVQWVFIPRFRALLDGDLPLPTACAVAPVAEIAFAEMSVDTGDLLETLRGIDDLVTGRRTKLS